MKKEELPFYQQVPIPIHYDGVTIESGYRADIIVNNEVILELKSVEQLIPLHDAQLLTYMRLSGAKSDCS
jgi:GxxExxY protein